MADKYIGVNFGQKAENVVVDTSTNSTAVELRVLQGTALTQADLIVAVDQIKAFVSKNDVL